MLGPGREDVDDEMWRWRIDLADHWVAIVVVGYLWIAAELGLALAVLFAYC